MKELSEGVTGCVSLFPLLTILTHLLPPQTHNYFCKRAFEGL